MRERRRPTEPSPDAPSVPKRILVIQTAHLGDVVLSTPLLRELRRSHPDAHIALLTTSVGRDLLSGSRWLDEILVYDKRWNRRGVPSYLRMIRRLLGSSFDVGIAAQRSIRTGMLLTFSRSRIRIGFRGAPGAWAYNRTVRRERGAHVVDRYLALAAPLGGEINADRGPKLEVDSGARRRVDRLLEGVGGDRARGIVCIAPGATWLTKRWPADRFAAAAREVAFRGWTPVLIGSPDETSLCREVAEQSGETTLDLAGSTSIPELVALIERSSLLVANDSGPAHIAAAVGTPVVQIFGPTVPELGYTAFGVPSRVVEHPALECRPCHRHGPEQCPLGHFRCMRDIQTTSVLEAIGGLLPARDDERVG
jgi:heptosyltransferase-2